MNRLKLGHPERQSEEARWSFARAGWKIHDQLAEVNAA